jgi:DNA-binding winged helix-turn-helix (wHTH) protein
MKLTFATCEIDTDARELRRAGTAVHLEPQVFDLLVYLVRNHARVVSKDELLDAVWQGRIVSETALSSRIKAARQAIGDDGNEQRLIKTVHRRGFRFVGAVTETTEAAAERAESAGATVAGETIAGGPGGGPPAAPCRTCRASRCCPSPTCRAIPSRSISPTAWRRTSSPSLHARAC